MRAVHLSQGDSLPMCKEWPAPDAIIADGPYGIDGYNGDLSHHERLADWYRPHVAEWTAKAHPGTTLWFWNTEVGWACVHPLLSEFGWEYRACNVWDKGIAHCAGNTNTQTLRKFPIVTEVCGHYVRKPFFSKASSPTTQDWMRAEWRRTGLPFSKANEACGVANAATRKYLTGDRLWYMPPPDLFAKLSDYANAHGAPEGRPYFAIDGTLITKNQWDVMRGTFHCPAGITNVWQVPAVRGDERVKIGTKALHPNQKPLQLMRMLIEASSEVDDVLWEPFGGLCSASLAGAEMDRNCFAAEITPETCNAATLRLLGRGVPILHLTEGAP